MYLVLVRDTAVSAKLKNVSSHSNFYSQDYFDFGFFKSELRIFFWKYKCISVDGVSE